MGKINKRTVLRTLATANLFSVALYGKIFQGKTTSQKWELTSGDVLKKPEVWKKNTVWIVKLGNLTPALVITTVETIALLRCKPSAFWVPSVSFTLSALAIKVFGKPYFAHELNNGYGYPSSHSGVLVSSLTSFVIVAEKCEKVPVVLTTVFGVLIFALPLAVWVGDYHRLSEILAGFLTGTTIGTLCATRAL